jgi:DNA-binding response OmpR family regulator
MLDKKRVLIVEDDPIIALDAEKLARNNEPDAAVLDVRLEVGDTIAFARDLRAKGIPFLFQTSDPRSLDVFEPKPVVLAKPFSPDKLVAAVRNLLGIPVS